MHTRELPLKIAPWALFRVVARKDHPFFFDAGLPWGDEWFSCMGFGPRMQLRIRADGRAALPALTAALEPIAVAPAGRARTRPVPFAGGAVVALAYETKNEIERLPQTQREDAAAPRLVAGFYDAVVAYDHHRRRYVVASWHLDAPALARYAEEILDAVAAARDHAEPITTHGATLTTSLDRDAYTARVERVRAYIAAGDIYQANLSMRVETPFAADPLAVYGRLRAAQPVPFGAYLDLGDARILSNSPELFLRRRGERVETCPIKGTRRRGRDATEDARLVEELRRDVKERAEHVMIVDLERSDLGRVCRTGSIHVGGLAEVATFRTLHHLTTTVRGTLPPAVGVAELLHATFPGGSITGAPKIRAMEIIDEVERGPRGFYTGALGWIDASGDLDLNVAIRTAVAAHGRLAYSVGSGIVADSDPEREHAECRLKAEAFVRALGADAIVDDARDAPAARADAQSAARRAS
jgi:para-aminobenzoate synthetase component 1